MTHATPEAKADMEWHLSIEQRAMSEGFCVAEHAPTYTLDDQITRARGGMTDKRWNELNAEWMA